METDADEDQYNPQQVQKGQTLRSLVNDRLTVTAEETHLDQDPPQTSWIKEEPEEPSVKQEEPPLLVQISVGVPESSADCVMTEESSLLQQRQTELREETQGEDISTEPYLHSETWGDTEQSFDTDNDEDWGAPSSCSALQMETDADEDHYNQVQKGQRLRALVNERLTVTAEETHLNQDTSQTSWNKEEPEELSVKQEEQQSLQKECSSDSSRHKTLTLDHSSDVTDNTGVPVRIRTENIILNKQMLMDEDYTTENSLSRHEFTEDEYLPKPNEVTSDTLSEDAMQHNSKKTEVVKASSAKPQKVKTHNKRQATCSTSLDTNDTQESSSFCDSDMKAPSAKSRKVETDKKRQATCSSSLDTDDTQESSFGGSEVKVMTLQKKEDGRRMYSKWSYCLFCFKPYSKIARHLEAKHRNEPEVKRAIENPPGSKERRVQLSLLRNRGNYAHNSQVLREGTGTVIPRQQSRTPVKSTDYMHCVNCQGYFKRKTLWKHMRNCDLQQKVNNLKKGKTRVQALCAYAQPVSDRVNEQFWRLVLGMKKDDVTATVRKEKAILKYGEHLFNKYGHDVTKHEYIKQKMRETGRLLLQGRKNGTLKEIMDFFIPANFPHVVEAVKNMAGLNVETSIFKTPSLAQKSGHNLKRIANLIECEGRISGDETAIHNVQVFKQICDTKWSECVSSLAPRNLSEAKRKVPPLLPFTEDVKRMHHYLDVQRQEYQTKLKEDPNRKHWEELAKVTLCEMIIFNHSRAGEVSKMPVNAFLMKDALSTLTDVELELSDLEKKLCKHFQIIEIKGKQRRKVPILLTPDMQASMELLVNTRCNCDVSVKNNFFFGRPKALSYFRGSDVIRQIAQSCGANYPKALSSTKLRKHMATMFKVLNLKDNEMDDLADFLGHDIRVHHQFYRLPEGTLQLAKISKILMALEKGKMSKFKGMNLDQINIDPQGSCSDDGEVHHRAESSPGPGKSCAKRRMWTEEEIQAVEKTLMNSIRTLKVPRKAQCLNCINTSPVALKGRTWKGVKFYVKNRIDALKSESAKQS